MNNELLCKINRWLSPILLIIAIVIFCSKQDFARGVLLFFCALNMVVNLVIIRQIKMIKKQEQQIKELERENEELKQESFGGSIGM